MPNYSFKCQECEYDFDIFKSINDNNQAKCPKCNSVKVKRIFKSIGVNLNFNGSYNSTRKN